MGTTANRSYPYPAGADPDDVPADMQALADAVDTDVDSLLDALAAVMSGSPPNALRTYEDDQGASPITSSGYLTNISISPAAGTYLAIATATARDSSSGGHAFSLEIHVNGTAQVGSGGGGAPGAGHVGYGGWNSPAVAGLKVAALVTQGLIVVGAGQAVQVYGALAGTDITLGHLTLLRVA